MAVICGKIEGMSHLDQLKAAKVAEDQSYADSLAKFETALDEAIDEAHHGTWESSGQIIDALRKKADKWEQSLQDDMSRH